MGTSSNYAGDKSKKRHKSLPTILAFFNSSRLDRAQTLATISTCVDTDKITIHYSEHSSVVGVIEY